jgi:outer membrane protein assembly factor BamB
MNKILGVLFMKKKLLTQMNVIIVVIILTFISLSSNNIYAQEPVIIETQSLDESDGVYYINDFSSTSLPKKNCVNPFGTTKITLNPHGSQIHQYNFTEWNKNSDHKAYFYSFPYFSPLILQKNVILTFLASEFEEEFGYPRLQYQDGNFYPMHVTNPSAFQQIHHYRLKLSQDLNSISNMIGTWYGKGNNVEEIVLYVWEPIYEPFGIWTEMDRINQTDELTRLDFEYSDDFPISENGYVDFCVVLTPEFSKQCILFTDFINLEVRGSGYLVEGYIRTPPISPESISKWQRADWNDYTPQNTNIKYQFLYENETGVLVPVSNSLLSGNVNKFTSGPIDLHKIPIDYNLSLNASFSTSDLSISPELYSLGLSWQKKETIWEDSFSSDLRTQNNQIDNVRIYDGRVSLIQSIYDWTMIHHNAGNTRKTPGLGPGVSYSNLLWFSNITVGGDTRNPIVKNNHIYIGSQDASRIIMYNDAQATTGIIHPNNNIIEKILPYDITNTPCATNRDTIIVATGSSSTEGNIENVIYAFDDMTLSEEWMFRYRTVNPDNPTICYSSSPIIHNNRIYITSWSGNSNLFNTINEYLNLSEGNNKLLCLSDQGVYQWSFDLPSASFSSPAVTDEFIIVGCENLINSSIFAVNSDGEKLWEQNVGPVGKASPIIYDDKVYIVSKQLSILSLTVYTQITALQLSNGKILWNRTLGDAILDDYAFAGYNTPCISEGLIIVATPDGFLSAINPENGELAWENRIYNKNIFSAYLTSSPSYGEGYIYIGTPDGYIHIYDTNGVEKWKRSTIGASSVISSPVIVDGLMYYYDENGILYCRGKVQIPQGQQITGSIISIPITKPSDQDLTWDRFYSTTTTSSASVQFKILDSNYNTLISNIETGQILDQTKLKNYNTIRLKAEFTANTNGQASLESWLVTFGPEPSEGTKFYDDSFESRGNPPFCQIDVKNDDDGINVSTAKYKLEYYDENNSFISTSYLPANCTGENISKNRETISVNLSKENYNENMSFYRIRFSISDVNNQITYSDWFTFTDQIIPDNDKPVFYPDSFIPESRFIISPTPICSIVARDKQTENNVTGINTGSARFEIQYRNDSGTHASTFIGESSGTNGTKNNVTLIADISKIDGAENIETLYKIRFMIADIAGNTNTSSWFELDMDDEPPKSTIINKESIESEVNTSPVEITINATDDQSGIKDIALYYRKTSQTSWTLFDSKKNKSPSSWDFSIGSNAGGEYELISIATDQAGNEESYPSTGELIFIFDPNIPTKPTFSSFYEYTLQNTNKGEIPTFSDITFRDDYLLDSVYYRLNFDGINEWRQINSGIINQAEYKPSWNLTSSQWNNIEEDITYSIYFRIIDVLGNTYETQSSADAMKIKKNFQSDQEIFTVDFSDFKSWKWNNEYQIKINLNDSDYQSISLYYGFSQKNISNITWKPYNESFNNESKTWDFTPTKGDGYYHFKIDVINNQGSLYTSEIKTVYIQLFPLMELIIIIILSIVLIFITIALIQKSKKSIS